MDGRASGLFIIPLASVELLRTFAHDVRSISQESPGIADKEVLQLACDDNRIVLTFDRDYGELVFLHKAAPPTAILYLRFAPRSPTEAGEIVQAFIAEHSARLSQNLCVLTRQAFRLRPFPKP